MNHPIEGSKKINNEANFTIFIEDLRKLERNEKGLTEGKYGTKHGEEKNPELIQEIQVGKVTKGTLYENGVIKSENGKQIDKFDFETVKEFNSSRMTRHAIKMREMKKQAGMDIE